MSPAQARYQASDKGKATQARYRASAKGVQRRDRERWRRRATAQVQDDEKAGNA